MKLPLSLQYASHMFTFVRGTRVTTGIPLWENIIQEFGLLSEEKEEGKEHQPLLPDGLVLDRTTGEIHGIPSALQDYQRVVVEGRNEVGRIAVELLIKIREGACPAESVFMLTTVGEKAVYECSREGNLVGTLERECVLGEVDGEWTPTRGQCTPVGIVIGWILAGLVIIGLGMMVFLRIVLRKKTGGLKETTAMKKMQKKRKTLEKQKQKPKPQLKEMYV